MQLTRPHPAATSLLQTSAVVPRMLVLLQIGAFYTIEAGCKQDDRGRCEQVALDARGFRWREALRLEFSGPEFGPNWAALPIQYAISEGKRAPACLLKIAVLAQNRKLPYIPTGSTLS